MISRGPGGEDGGGQIVGGLELPSARASGSHEVGIAELAGGDGPIGLATGPQIAAREPAEDGSPSGLCPLSLERKVNFLDDVRQLRP